MLLLLKFIVIIIMLIGLGLTVIPRFPGTVVILAGAGLFSLGAGFAFGEAWIWDVLIGLVLIAEGGGRLLRRYLTRRYQLGRQLAAASTIGNIGGVLVTNALFGPVWGVLLWELLVGKTMAPRWDSIYTILLRLVAAAAVRFVCGVVMIVVVIGWLM
ncbi:MAG: hypothetical protein H6Q74_181 [Firmicutes bacterium]|nr:hypothetical protein [Bacillota bacterium]